MDFAEALEKQEWDRVLDTLPYVDGVSLAGALSEARTGDLDGPSPVGLWHVAAVRRSVLVLEGEPFSDAALEDGMALRDAMVARAKVSEVTTLAANRDLTKAGYLVVRSDGTFASWAPPEPVVFDGASGPSSVTLDLFDHVEDASWRSPIDGDGETLEQRWDASRDTRLVSSTDAISAEVADVFEAALGVRGLHAATVIRRMGRLVLRTLYVGDFSADPLTRIDTLILMHRRLWAPEA
ncbi:MAG: hypothetical protein AB8I08_26015 [Sandaracinaceae bacterium]